MSNFNIVTQLHVFSVTDRDKLRHEQLDLSLFSVVNVVGSIEAPSNAFLLFFLLSDWLKLNHLRSRTECSFSDIFAPYLFHCSRNNRRDKLCSTFWPEKCSESHI